MEGLTPAEQFLTTTFFPRTQFFEGRFAQVDSRKGRRLLAPIVKYGQPGRAVSREAITTKFYDLPEIKPVRVSTVVDLDQRLLGENCLHEALGGRTPRRNHRQGHCRLDRLDRPENREDGQRLVADRLDQLRAG